MDSLTSAEVSSKVLLPLRNTRLSLGMKAAHPPELEGTRMLIGDDHVEWTTPTSPGVDEAGGFKD